MPVYTYICNKCGEKFDLLIGVTSGETELKCKKCRSKDIQRTFSSFNAGHSGDKSGSSGPSCPTGTCSLQ